MAEDFEDPRKAELRARAATAADAAGYAVDPERPVIPHLPASGLRGGIRADVVATGAASVRALYFIRVDGEKPLPQWLANHVRESFEMERIEVYVVVEAVGSQLRATCDAAGAGLLALREDDTFDLELPYKAPDLDTNRRRLQARIRRLRSRLDTKLQLNQSRLQTAFQESSAVTSTMDGKRRDVYLDDIEDALVSWRDWSEDLSVRLDAAAASESPTEIDEIERAINSGP